VVVREPVEIGTLLYRKEGFRAGRPCLADTGMTVHTVAGLQLQGLAPEEILEQFPHLDLPRIYAALAYFFANRDLVIAEMDADEFDAERLSREFNSLRPD
jgi:uncharacterized protein (DUF433 family)